MQNLVFVTHVFQKLSKKNLWGDRLEFCRRIDFDSLHEMIMLGLVFILYYLKMSSEPAFRRLFIPHH